VVTPPSNGDPRPSPPKHLASIDLEDWYNDVERTGALTPDEAARAFDRQLEAIVSILDSARTRCTFFVLGSTAERFPHWVARLHREGHEIASHGFGHERVYNLSPALLEDDLKRSMDVLGGITGESPFGYRAPYFSVDRERFWFYDVLVGLGFRYSSSVFPFRGRQYGIADHATSPQLVRRNGGEVVEFPLSVAEFAGVRIPIAGGGFWRLLPASVIDRFVGQAERAGHRFTMYLHPHEFDAAGLRSHRGRFRNLYVNLGRASVPEKFRRILSRYDFGTFRELLGR
jgi:polysaccharide deacetylase family protein (PEP-CTERM system associated)